METAPITSAVVRLSATGDITNASPPVTQKSWRSESSLMTLETTMSDRSIPSSR